MDTAVVDFINKKNNTTTEIEIPLNITVNDLLYGLNEAFGLGMNSEDYLDYYLVSENPIAFLRGNRNLEDYGIRNGSRIIFKRS